MSLYERVADLPLTIERYELEGLEQAVSSGFVRATTLVRLIGDGEQGVGEDVTYEQEDQVKQQRAGAHLPLAGRFTLDELSRRLETLDLFSEPPLGAASRYYRRWAFESAALDLALLQAGRGLGDLLGREPRPVRFVISMRLGEPATIEPLLRWLRRYPGLRFKLDPTDSWSDELVAQLVDTGTVDSVDFKGAYRGTPVDLEPDAVLYRRVAEAFPRAWLEDPALTPETLPVLEPHRERITWDAPIHSTADIEALPYPPRMINVKPSRFATLRSLLDAYDYCESRGIDMYGGGQFELGIGRGQIQYLASLFHADGPNDVAPAGYNASEPAAGLPESPLAVAAAPVGFRWG